MTNVEKLIRDEAMSIAKKQSRFISSKDDVVKATVNVLSSKGSELRSIMDEVEAFNNMKRGN